MRYGIDRSNGGYFVWIREIGEEFEDSFWCFTLAGAKRKLRRMIANFKENKHLISGEI